MECGGGGRNIGIEITEYSGPKYGTAENWLASPAEPNITRTVSVISADDVRTLVSLRSHWEQLVRDSGHVNALYQSPQFFDHLVGCGSTKPFLAIIRDAAETCIGLVPFVAKPYPLKFDMFGKVLGEKTFQAVKILGSQPLLPCQSDVHDRFFSEIRLKFPASDCVVMESVPVGSYLNDYLQDSDEIRTHWIVHYAEGTRRYPLIQLPESFAEYLAKFGSKTRYNLKREHRLLREVGGSLHLERVSTVEQVDSFLASARVVTANSQSRGWLDGPMQPDSGLNEQLVDLARRGILQSYTLMCGDRPCAFVWGYRFADVYHLVETAFDQDFARFSPGKVLLYSLIEDLIRVDRARVLTFDFGEAFYKDLFANWFGQDRSIVLFRRTLKNWFWRALHQMFRASVTRVRRWLNWSSQTKTKNAFTSKENARSMPMIGSN